MEAHQRAAKRPPMGAAGEDLHEIEGRTTAAPSGIPSTSARYPEEVEPTPATDDQPEASAPWQDIREPHATPTAGMEDDGAGTASGISRRHRHHGTDQGEGTATRSHKPPPRHGWRMMERPHLHEIEGRRPPPPE